MKDYADSGMDIQSAMVDMVKAHPDKGTRPDHILWDGREVRTMHWVPVPNEFRVTLEFVSEPDIDQAADIKVEDGYLTLAGGEQLSLPRTWHDPDYEPTVQYWGHSRSGRILVYNVSRVARAGRVSEEKWTGNAGMLVEQAGPSGWLYRCSSAASFPPNFGDIVFKVTINETEANHALHTDGDSAALHPRR